MSIGSVVLHLQDQAVHEEQDEEYSSNTTKQLIYYCISIYYQATCFDPLTGSSSGRGITEVVQKSKGFDILTFVLNRPQGVRSRGRPKKRWKDSLHTTPSPYNLEEQALAYKED
jgi:hypothetical protein